MKSHILAHNGKNPFELAGEFEMEQGRSGAEGLFPIPSMRLCLAIHLIADFREVTQNGFGIF